MIKLLKTLLMVSVLSLSFNSYGNDADTQAALDKEITTKEATVDLMNRFVFAFFGKDALQSFEPRKISDLDSKDYEDASQIAVVVAPFPYLFTKISFLFYIVYSMSLMAFIIYLVFLIYFGIFRSQASGSFMGQSWNSTYIVVKIFIALLLLAPIAGEEVLKKQNEEKAFNMLDNLPKISNNIYSVSQILAFKVAGYSNFHGRAINNAIIDNQPSLYPSLPLPVSDSKMFELKKLLDYSICIKTNIESSEEIVFYVKESYSGVTISSSSGKCGLSFSMGIDTGAISVIESNPDLKAKYPDFRGSQIEIIKSLFSELIQKSALLSSVLITQSEDKLELVDSRFSEYTKDGAKSDSNSHWESHCEDIFNYTLDLSKPLLEHEAKQYAYLGLRCLSYEVNKKILLPNIANVASFIKSANYLKERKIELCTQKYNVSSSDVKSATLIGDSDKINALNINSSNTTSYRFMDVSDCIETACSNLSPAQEYTQLYSCSNAILLYKKNKEQETFKDLGVISLSANLFRIFSTHDPVKAKSVYNNLKTDEYRAIKNTGQASRNNKDLDYDSKFSINIMKKEASEKLYSLIMEYNYFKIEEQYFSIVDDGSWQSTAMKFLRSEKAGLMGSDRLFSCAQYPMTFHNGFNCGSITEEYTVFGKGLISSSLQYHAMSQLLKSSSSSKAKGGGDISLKEKPPVSVKKVLLDVTTRIVKYLGMAMAVDFLFDSTTETDDFGDLTSKDMNMLQYNEELAAFYTATSNNKATAFIDWFFTAIGYVGLLFAYIIPFYPFFIALSLFLEWFLLFMNTLILIPFCSVYIIKPSSDHSSQVFATTFSILISLFLKIPFLMIGLILGWVLANTVISRALSLFDFSAIMGTGASSMMSNLLNPLIMLVVYGLIIFMFTNIALTVIEKFYSFATDWIIKMLGSSPAAQSPTGLYGAVKNNTAGAKGAGKSGLSKNVSARFGGKT